MIDLDPDLGERFAPWVTALRRLIGPLGRKVTPDRGAPDGFDGITRRGPYDRMLASEWALADEAPDEFLRRAAERELSFLRVMRREAVRARTSVALLDAGPAQLGAPRVGHLPIVLALASRAADAGARFGVQAVHAPPPGVEGGAALLGDVTAASLTAVMRANSLFEPDPATVRAWLDLARRAGWDDLWIIGDRVVPGLDPPPARLAVHRVVVREEPPRGLRVEVRQGRSTRAASFELPPEPQCVRVLAGRLREPTRRQVARAQAFDVVSTPLLLADGRKLVARNREGHLVLFTVPDMPSPKDRRPGQPRVIRPPHRERVLAAGWFRRRVVMLGHGDHGIALFDHCNDRIVHGRRGLPLPDELITLARELPPDAPLGALVVDVGPTVYWLDPWGRVFRFRDGAVEQVDRDALAVEFVRGQVQRLTRSGEAEGSARRVVSGLRGYCGDIGGARDVFAYERAPGEWVIEPGQSVVQVPADGETVGLSDLASLRPHVLALSADRRELRAHRSGHVEAVFAEATPITHANVTPRGRRIAIRRADGVVRVFDVERRAWLLSTPAEGYP